MVHAVLSVRTVEMKERTMGKVAHQIARSVDQAAVLAFMEQANSYPGAIDTVDRIDTHGAVVFLAGDKAYKIRRAVKYPYLDYSTLKRRGDFSQQEVDLNRRTAPNLYIGVLPVTLEPGNQFKLDGNGKTVEWVVVMRRFEQNALFDHMLERDALSSELVANLGDEIRSFHDAAEVVTTLPPASGGGADGIRWVVEEGLDEFRQASDHFSAEAVARLAGLSQTALGQLTSLLDQRMKQGRVRKCHGDLHLRNICLFEGRPTLFDAIEFDPRLSEVDVLYDIAFLIMDLDRYDRRDLANQVLNRYFGDGVDLEALAALPLFLSARAGIRAKVAVTAEASQDDDAHRQALRNDAQAYFEAAVAYLEAGRPSLIAIGGLSGSGKTTVARGLAPSIGRSPGALIARSDVIRKQHHGVSETARLPASTYTRQESEAVYAEMMKRASRALDAGQSVILDAVFAHPEERNAAKSLAADQGVEFLGIWLDVPADTMKSRIEARHGDASDATAAVLERQIHFQLGPLDWHRIDADGASDAVIATTKSVATRQLG